MEEPQTPLPVVPHVSAKVDPLGPARQSPPEHSSTLVNSNQVTNEIAQMRQELKEMRQEMKKLDDMKQEMQSQSALLRQFLLIQKGSLVAPPSEELVSQVE